MKYCDVVISVRDREQERVQRCVKYLRKCPNIKNIFVMDNSLTKPLTSIEDAEVIKLEYYGFWNKSWVLNRGIKLCTSEYLMTIDCDIILSEEILTKIVDKLDKDTVIFNKNIRRLKQFNVSEDYSEMLSKSYPWFEDPFYNLYNEANGGIQVMPLEWIKKVGGYDENAGLLWGGMDNRIWEQATMDKKVIININTPMLHIEHKNKEDNLNNENKHYAEICRSLKRIYLKSLINRNDIVNDSNWGNEQPNDEFMKFLTQNELDKETEYLNHEIKKNGSLGFKEFAFNNMIVKIDKE